MGKYRIQVVKALFARSCNRCAFPGCDLPLASDRWDGVRADIAHIHGEHPGSTRYDPTMSEEDRNGLDNLMLLCPNHHRQVDDLEPDEWPAERLMQMKAGHERSCDNQRWAGDTRFEVLAAVLLAATPGAVADGGVEKTAADELGVQLGERVEDVLRTARPGVDHPVAADLRATGELRADATVDGGGATTDDIDEVIDGGGAATEEFDDVLDGGGPDEGGMTFPTQFPMSFVRRPSDRDRRASGAPVGRRSRPPSFEAGHAPGPMPRLLLERGDGQAFVAVNVGDGEAYGVVAQPAPNTPSPKALIMANPNQIERLSPGGRWQVGLYAPSASEARQPVMRLIWRDEYGDSYDGEFPVPA